MDCSVTCRLSIESLREPTPTACARVLEILSPLPAATPDWQPLQAPGSRLPPSPDARQVWMPLTGWARLSVPSDYDACRDIEGDGWFTSKVEGLKRYPVPTGPGEIEITRDLALPDQWPVARHYHHAWYAWAADFAPEPQQQTWIRFDAVAQVCVLFVNGREVGRYQGGDTPFGFDISACLKPGRNALALWVQDETAIKDTRRRRAVSQLGSGGGSLHAHVAGIRGGVYLETRTPAHVSRLRVRTSTRRGLLRIETWLCGATPGVRLRHAVYEWPDGRAPVLELPESTADSGTATADAEGVWVCEQSWPDAKLWSPANPALYVLRTTVTDGTRIETIETRFGFREFWIEGTQFMLNGKPIRLLGDAGPPKELKSVLPEGSREYNRRALEFLKRVFHFTSTRLHRIMFPPWAVQAADEAGVLVINQTGLHCGCREYYCRGGEAFLRNLETEFAAWYWRDVNSPSVVIWDVENELIRDKRWPELEAWVLKLDDFIRRHDPDAIIQHAGAAWYHPDQQIIHVHMQEQYARLMREWQADGKIPMIMGEFWMGGRGETRLPNSYEYIDREDWHREEARLYREKMLEMRNAGISGIMPHRLLHWPLVRSGAMLSEADRHKAETPPYRWRFKTIRNQGARGMAPVVGFVWPRSGTVIEGESFTREIVVCNDREDFLALQVSCAYGSQRETWRIDLAPAAQWRMAKQFDPEPASDPAGEADGVAGTAADLTVEVRDSAGELLESDRLAIHPVSPEAVRPPVTRRKLVVVPHADAQTAAALKELGLAYTVEPTLPDAAAAGTIVLVPPGAADDALGRTDASVRRYLADGGRLLVLAQTAAPRWLPQALPFWSAVRASAPEFDRGGWAPTNKDLVYTREAPVYAGNHPAFAHLEADDLKEWGDDGRVSDDAFIRPNAVRTQLSGAWRVLLGGTRRELASLLEYRHEQGTALFCQVHVLRQCDNAAARVLYFNLLRYLDGPAWVADQDRVGLLGELSPAVLAQLTGLAATCFTPVEAGTPAPPLVLAGDRADPRQLQALAQAGSRVLILSCETCARLPGFAVEQTDDGFYSATRGDIVDHPLFWGVAGASFLPLEQTPARGALSRIPDDWQVLLGGHARGHSPFQNDWTLDIGFYGLEAREPAPPLAAGLRIGKGELIATTLEPRDARAGTHGQLLRALLANAGVPVPTAPARGATLDIRHTVPLCFDGRLDDWTNDTDDINLSLYSHARPIVISSRDAISGTAANDLEASAILYLLHDEQHLYLGGICFPADCAYRVETRFDDLCIHIAPETQTVAIDGTDCKPAVFATGTQPACEVIDTGLLNLMRINRQIHRAESHTDAPGRTFELALSWDALGFDKPPERLRGQFRLCREDGLVLQQPAAAADGADWINLPLMATANPNDAGFD